MIQTYFGNGKGKTTAAVGSAIRFAGCGNKVLFVQFLKNNDSPEFKAMKQLKNIDVLYSDKYYELFDNLNKECTAKFEKAYSRLLFDDTKNVTESYQMIILDEILDAIQFGYIPENEFNDFLCGLKNTHEIILTGHSILKGISDISDYISEIKEIKHPYTNGVLPRKGIEF